MSDQPVGSSVQSCGSSAPSSPPAPDQALAPANNDPTHHIEFHFQVESGQTIGDPDGFTLIHPDGSKEKGMLSGGGFERDGVPEGAYQMKFQYIKTCGWRQNSAVGEPRVGMFVTTKGFPAGTAAVFQVFQRFETRLNPVETVSAAIQNHEASAVFAYKQKVSERAGGDFVFEVSIGIKRGFSDVLTILPYPLETTHGVQQRLKQLGFDPGPIDGIAGPLTRQATLAFQKLNPELDPDGIPGPLTKRELAKA